MDAKTLTPHLRRRVLALSAADRAVLAREIADSLADPRRGADNPRLTYLFETMCSLTGLDISSPCRRADYVRARSVFIHVARCEGYSERRIAAYLGMNHSTVSFMSNRMPEAMEAPAQWPDYIALYDDFIKRIAIL